MFRWVYDVRKFSTIQFDLEKMKKKKKIQNSNNNKMLRRTRSFLQLHEYVVSPETRKSYKTNKYKQK